MLILHGHDGRVEIQLAAVVGHLLVAGEFEEQVAKGLVGDLAEGHAHELVHGELLSLALFSFEQKSPNLRQVSGGARVGVVAWTAGPECVFVELDAVVGSATEDHATEAAIADGKGCHPVVGRFVVPEFGGAGDGWLVGGGGETCQGNQEEGEEVSHGVVSSGTR